MAATTTTTQINDDNRKRKRPSSWDINDGISGTKNVTTSNIPAVATTETTIITTTRTTCDAWSRVAAATAATLNADCNNPASSTSGEKSAASDGTTISTTTTATTLGRGSLTGWTSCPLCNIISASSSSSSQKKYYALGRGLAHHLKDVHTPWKPSKMAQKMHRRQQQRRQQHEQANLQRIQRQQPQRRNGNNDDDVDDTIKDDSTTVAALSTFQPLQEWEPTNQEVDAWNRKMLDILHQVEQQEHQRNTSEPPTSSNSDNANTIVQPKATTSTSYRESLPPFLQAAANGNLQTLKEMAQTAKENNGILDLLNTTDRHNSKAEHWAAGGGHLDCLTFLHQERTLAEANAATANHKSPPQSTTASSRKVRRRDGKTSLHYAARNGHIPCIQFLLKETTTDGCKVDEPSGDGTTPLHMACYGGQYEAAKYLIDECGASPLQQNDWGCSCAHFVAMTIAAAPGKDDSENCSIRKLCNLLAHDHGVSFVSKQGQGHTALHKAAHRGNQAIIQWMADDNSQAETDGGAGLTEEEKIQAGAPDLGGHKPSDIWTSMGYDEMFGTWMRSTMGW